MKRFLAAVLGIIVALQCIQMTPPGEVYAEEAEEPAPERQSEKATYL